MKPPEREYDDALNQYIGILTREAHRNLTGEELQWFECPCPGALALGMGVTLDSERWMEEARSWTQARNGAA